MARAKRTKIKRRLDSRAAYKRLASDENNLLYVAVKHLAKQIEVFQGAQTKQMEALLKSVQHMSTAVVGLAQEELRGIREHLNVALPVSRRVPWGFGEATIDANGSYVFESGLDTVRPFVVTRMLISVAKPGLYVSSFRVGARELLRGGSVPADLFGVLGHFVEQHPAEMDEFGIVHRGERVAITLSNPMAEAVRVSVGLRGHLETDRERAERLEREMGDLRAAIALRERNLALHPMGTLPLDESADHDRALCDCSDCVNWRRARASHVGVTLPPD